MDENVDEAQLPTRSKKTRVLLLACLLFVFATLCYSAAWTKCNTFDENAHLTNGFIFWDTGDFRLIPEALLLQRYLSLPIFLAGFQAPDYESASAADPPGAWYAADDWSLSDEFLYSPQLGNDADTLLRTGRAMNVLLAVLLGLLVYRWSSSLFGETGGLVSLVLFVFSPTLLANSGLVTMDLGAATLFAASVWALWNVLHQLTFSRVVFSTVAMGGLFVTKLTAVLIIPIGLLLLAVRLVRGQPLPVRLFGAEFEVPDRLRQLLVFLLLIGVHVIVAWAIIWAMFSFRFSMIQPGRSVTPDRSWEAWSQRLQHEVAGDWKGDLVRLAHQNKLLPEAYIMAATHTVIFTSAKAAFLNGEESATGWRIFFPYCLLVKTPLPLLATVALAGLAALVACSSRATDPKQKRSARMRSLQKIKAGLYDTSPLWIWLIVFWTAAIQSQFNVGHRHILPTYPPMIILAGAAGAWLQKKPASKDDPISIRGRSLLRGLTVILLVWLVLESVLAWPNYLAYFNQLIGGPRNGYRHLVDSSLDWGQDLPALKKWLDREGRQSDDSPPVYLSYFGTASREYYGIRAQELRHAGPGYQFISAQPGVPWRGGIYCISATALQTNGVSSDFGRWSALDEKTYQEMQGIVRFVERDAEDRSDEQRLLFLGEQMWKNDRSVSQRLGLPPDVRPTDEQLKEVGGMFLDETYWNFDTARFGRLVAFLREREPDDQINYSIMIYRLSDDDVQQALFGPPPELTASISKGG